MQVWTNLCDRESFSVTNCWQQLHFEFSRLKLKQECAETFFVVTGDDSSHTAKAILEKGSSLPSEAIPYGVYLRVDF